MRHLPAVILLMLVYMASLIGFTTPHQQEWYLSYTPFFLLLNGGILLLYQKEWTIKTLLFWGSTVVVGGIVESLAIQTGALYGSYSFGSSLGYKIGGVPFGMLFYWLSLVGSTAIIAAQTLPKSKVGRIALGTTLAIGLNVLIQQVAARLDFWYLDNALLWRYVLVQSLIIACLQYLFIYWRLSNKNAIAGYIYGGLLTFFSGVVLFLA